jgi:hypothetical protein
LRKALSDFLEEFPFATAGIIAWHSTESKPITKEIVQRELGLQRFSRKWISHWLWDAQKVDRTAMATDLLSVLHRQACCSFLSDYNRRRVLISLPISLRPHIRSQSRWSDSKRKIHDRSPARDVDDFSQRCKSHHSKCIAIWCTIHSRILHE